MGLSHVSVADMERASDGKADAFFYTKLAAGSALQLGAQAALDEAIAKLPIPKVMSYQRPDGETVQFVRPAHSLIALHGETIVPLTLLGLTASNKTEGHRFLTAPGKREVSVPNADITPPCWWNRRAWCRASKRARKPSVPPCCRKPAPTRC